MGRFWRRCVRDERRTRMVGVYRVSPSLSSYGALSASLHPPRDGDTLIAMEKATRTQEQLTALKDLERIQKQVGRMMKRTGKTEAEFDWLLQYDHRRFD